MIREDATRSMPWAVAAAFIVLSTCVSAVPLLPGRSFVMVMVVGIPAGLIIAGAFRLFVERFGDRYAPT